VVPEAERCARTAPNQALEPTPNSFRSSVAPAIGRGSPPAFGNRNRSLNGVCGIGGSMHIDLNPVATLDDDERAALQALTAAVYPPEVVEVSPGRHFQWVPPE
jgi:hypothetical protein